MKYHEIRTVWSGQELKEAEFPGYFNIEVGERDNVFVSDQCKGVSIHFGAPYEDSNRKGSSRAIFENEDIRIVGSYSRYKEHDGKLTGILLIKKNAP